jgi:ubiquinone/menaquinone biosynthesis C-methylase UbiE
MGNQFIKNRACTMALNIKEAVQKQFHAVAANYSASSVHAHGVDLAAMLNVAALTGDERILDAGCGSGHTAFTFAPHVAQITAVDLTLGMLDEARRRAGERGLTNIDFRLGDVEQLAFADQHFDLVVTRLSAHHWPHPQGALSEFRRVLRPGGRLLLSDIVAFDDFTADTFLQAIELLRDPSHVRDHGTHQWLAMCAEAGLPAEVVFTWGVRLDFADWVARMRTPPAHVAAIHSLLDGAPADLKAAFKLEADHSFTLPGALIRARRTDQTG